MNTPTTPDDPLGIKEEAPAPMGHNLPPAYDEDAFEVLAKRIDAFLEVSDKWLAVEINTKERAERLNDQIGGLRKLWAEVEAARVAEKKPHDTQGQAVQDAFKPQLDRVSKAATKLKPLLDAFTLEEQRKIDAEAERQRQIARDAELAAQKAAEEAAASKSIDAELEAEEAAKAAADAAKLAAKTSKTKAKVASASGGTRSHSTRKTKTVKINNIRHLFMHFQNDPKVHDVLQALANQHVRAAGFDGKDLPGTETIES